jgi:hypothetical protein
LVGAVEKMICKESFYMSFIIFFVLQKIMLFIALRFSSYNIPRIMIVDFLFTVILLIDVPWIIHVTSGVCT